jgi:hypothetical protein
MSSPILHNAIAPHQQHTRLLPLGRKKRMPLSNRNVPLEVAYQPKRKAGRFVRRQAIVPASVYTRYPMS